MIKIPQEDNARAGFLEPEDVQALLAELPAHLKPAVAFPHALGNRRGKRSVRCCVADSGERARSAIGGEGRGLSRSSRPTQPPAPIRVSLAAGALGPLALESRATTLSIRRRFCVARRDSTVFSCVTVSAPAH